MVVFGLAVAIVLAAFVSPFVSSSPDGLEKVAAEKALDTDEQEHALGGGPLADYAVDGVDDERLATGVAGVIGVVATFGVGAGAFALLRFARRGTVQRSVDDEVARVGG
jgi:cobalt/nickel transport system permease protein